MTKEKAVLIAGGYGVVGEQVAALLRKRNADLPIIIGGRDKAKADATAKKIGNSTGIRLDVLRPGAITALTGELAAVVPVVNDRNDYLLVEAIRAGIPYIDITRWTSWQRDSIIRASYETMTAPVIFSSAWMAGVVAMVAKKLSEKFEQVDTVDIDILFALTDKAGPNSLEYADQLSKSFDIIQDGNVETVMPMTDPKMATFAGGETFKTYRFDTPDQMTLPVTLGANTVNGRIGYDDKFTVSFLAGMIKFGIWKILERPMFEKIRHSMLYNPGEGGAHKVTVQMTGRLANGTSKTIEATINDKEGQTHLTAVGTIVQIERALGLNGAVAAPAGITYPELHEDIDLALDILCTGGVEIMEQVEGQAAVGLKKSYA